MANPAGQALSSATGPAPPDRPDANGPAGAGRRIAVRALRGLPLSAVPDKRQTSKQRRAARNRAAREALNARRTHAVTSSASPGPSRAASATPGGAAGNGARTGGRAAAGGFLSGFARGRRRPGDMAGVVALGVGGGAG